MLKGAYIFPHPPIIIPEIGRGEETGATATISGVKELARRIADIKPNIILVITPHGPVFDDAVCISVEQKLYGDFKRFGKGNIGFRFENDVIMAERISASANLEDILVGEIDKEFSRKYNISLEIDHGTLVPLYFVNQLYTDYKLIHISIGLLPYQDLFRFGMSINNIIKEYGEKVVVIASGDLSHRLTASASDGYNPRGKEFDELFVSLIRENNPEGILEINEDLIESAGECGLRPTVILQGILDGYDVKSEVLSYEGPFGVGYMTAKYEILGESKTGIYERIAQKNIVKMQEIRRNEDEYIKLARMSLEDYVKNKKIIEVPKDTSKELLENKAGVFVSIKKHGKLHGCIGTISSTKDNIAQEIISNAISSGTKDNRFYPVDENELKDLIYSVDILKDAEKVGSKEELDVKKYGVIVSKGFRRGLLLPNLEGVDTIEQQISIALSKAGIGEHEDYSIERFEVIRHGSK